MAEDKPYNVLFLCTHNSARSIMAEVIVNYVGHGKFKGFSAGSHPTTAPNPFALETLRRMRFSTDGLHSKDWNEFAKPEAPVMHFVLTVCDKAAGEVCPSGLANPSRRIGASKIRRNFRERTSKRCTNLFGSPMSSSDASN